MATKKQKKSLLLPIVALVCALSVVAMIAALCCPKTEMGEFVRPPFDGSACAGTPNVPDGLGWQTLDAMAFQFAVCGKFAPDGDRVDVWLTNPATNSVWMKLRVLDASGQILGETGLIKPNEYVQSLTLTRIPASGEKVTLKIMTYQPETYYSEGAVTLDTTVS